VLPPHHRIDAGRCVRLVWSDPMPAAPIPSCPEAAAVRPAQPAASPALPPTAAGGPRRAWADRAEAGRALAAALAGRSWPHPPLVLALPRGGVPVAAEVARALRAPLDLLMVRKIGAPGQPELAVAAVARLSEQAVPQLATDEPLMRCTGADRAWVDQGQQRELAEIARRRRRYLGDRCAESLAGRTALVVDDGLATGTTARAAVLALRHAQPVPARIVLAVPVASAEAARALAAEVDELVCLWQPEPFHAVGAHYRDFRQVDDDAVVNALSTAARRCVRQAAKTALS
jgi:putative phosphoribosyl transferase